MTGGYHIEKPSHESILLQGCILCDTTTKTKDKATLIGKNKTNLLYSFIYV